MPAAGASGVASAPRAWAAYALAATLALAGVALKATLGRQIPATYIFAVPAVLAPAALGGLGPGLVGTALSAVLTGLWVLAPSGEWGLDRGADAIALALFVVVGIAVSVGAEVFRSKNVSIATLKRSEADLAAIRKRLSEVIEASADGYFDHDHVRGKTYRSARANEMLGLPAAESEVDVDEWLQVVHPDDVSRMADAARSMASGATDRADVTLRARMQDGAWRWRRLRMKVAERGPDGRPVRTTGTVTDVHAQRVAEDALAESERRLALALDGSDDGIADIDLVTGAVFRSPRLYDILGWPADEVPKDIQGILGLIHPEDAGEVKRRMAALFAGGLDAIDDEFRVRTKAGDHRWVRRRLKVVARDVAGKPTRVSGTVSDVTERHALGEELASSERRFRSVFENSPLPTLLTRTDGRVLAANPAAQAALGWSEAEITALGRQGILEPTAEAARATDARLRDGTVTAEVALRKSNGSTFIADVTSTIFQRNPEGGLAVTHFRDLTVERGLQAQLQVASRLAALGTLVAGIAHEVNNPLAGAMAGQGYAVETLRDLRALARRGELVDQGAVVKELDDVLDGLTNAEVGLRRIARIVRDLTAFGRSDQRKGRVRLVDAVEQAMRWLPAAHVDSAAISVESMEAPAVTATSGQMTQVVLNLVTNAVKSMPKGRRGLVKIRVGPGRPGTARLEVEDDGAGMTPDVMGRIFDPFFTTREVGQGMGLGLAVTHAIVTEHGGTISVRSEVGKGSTFTVELPAAPAER